MSTPTHRIIPRRGVYWIEVVRPDGAWQRVEGFDTEEAALTRLHELEPIMAEVAKQTAPTSLSRPSKNRPQDFPLSAAKDEGGE